jgi:hypothetical protein
MHQSHDEMLAFERVKVCRNSIAHGMNRMLLEGLPTDFSDRFNDIVCLLSKIEKLWIINVEIPINPDLADKDTGEDEIVPGPIAGLQMLIDIALGSEDESNFYFNEFIKRTGSA